MRSLGSFFWMHSDVISIKQIDLETRSLLNLSAALDDF